MGRRAQHLRVSLKGVIVAGETRYKAAVLIGLTAAPVVTIPARQARAFRVIDNRTRVLLRLDPNPDRLEPATVVEVSLNPEP